MEIFDRECDIENTKHSYSKTDLGGSGNGVDLDDGWFPDESFEVVGNILGANVDSTPNATVGMS